MFYTFITFLIPHFYLNKIIQFYLAFENSLCRDYITEKFWKVLSYNVVPVVLNGVNMSRVAPPHSYIDIKDFDSVEGQTPYMQYVHSD